METDTVAIPSISLLIDEANISDDDNIVVVVVDDDNVETMEMK